MTAIAQGMSLVSHFLFTFLMVKMWIDADKKL